MTSVRHIILNFWKWTTPASRHASIGKGNSCFPVDIPTCLQSGLVCLKHCVIHTENKASKAYGGTREPPREPTVGLANPLVNLRWDSRTYGGTREPYGGITPPHMWPFFSQQSLADCVWWVKNVHVGPHFKGSLGYICPSNEVIFQALL